VKSVLTEQHQAEFSIKAMCRVLRVARSDRYVWRNRHRVIVPASASGRGDSIDSNAFVMAKQRYDASRV